MTVPSCTAPSHDLYALLHVPLVEVEKVLHEAFAHDALPMLKAISAHIIGSGGKRIRPVLCVTLPYYPSLKIITKLKLQKKKN